MPSLTCLSMLHSDDITYDEALDITDPLRHLMQQADENGLSESDYLETSSEFLSVLPKQSHSVHDETLQLSFLNRPNIQQAPITISLFIDASPGCGGVAWPAGQVCDLGCHYIILPTYHASQVLSSYLVKRGSSFVQGRTILELGSGTGLVGLVAGKLGGNVWITDQAFVSFQFGPPSFICSPS